MALWKVESSGDYIAFGDKKRKKLFASGCNEPFKDAYWCPKKKWFFKSPCPFVCKRECENYKAMCGVL